MAVMTLAGLRSDPPALFLVLPGVWVALDVALLVCLWLPSTSAYVNGSWQAPAPRSRASEHPSGHPSA